METKFIDLALNKLSKNFKLTEIDLKQDSVMKKKGMTFYNHCYEIDGLGHLSTTSMTGMFGFMKMESVILSVDNKDIPLSACYLSLTHCNNPNLFFSTNYSDCDNPKKLFTSQ